MSATLPTTQGGDLFNLNESINRVVNRFELENGFAVSSSGRSMLGDLAELYKNQIVVALDRGQTTGMFLETTLLTLLEEARDLAETLDEAQIEAETIRQVLAEGCPFLFLSC